jgi:V8-like Glu-specific endopeptidase
VAENARFDDVFVSNSIIIMAFIIATTTFVTKGHNMTSCKSGESNSTIVMCSHNGHLRLQT